jgi:hypothetical protein
MVKRFLRQLEGQRPMDVNGRVLGPRHGRASIDTTRMSPVGVDRRVRRLGG